MLRFVVLSVVLALYGHVLLSSGQSSPTIPIFTDNESYCAEFKNQTQCCEENKENIICVFLNCTGNATQPHIGCHWKTSNLSQICYNETNSTIFNEECPADIYHGRGNGGESIYGPLFEDENFAIKHTGRGILGMANTGRHTNGSQFYICLQPAPWMNTKYVAFGKIIEGTETLAKMEAVETMNERPNSEIKISDCGVLTFEF